MRRRGFRTASFGLPIAGDVWVWHSLHSIGHQTGLLILFAATTFWWPLLMLAVLFGLPALVHAAVPVGWRRRYRRAHGRAGARSAYIPRWLRAMALSADRHRCVSCGAGYDLQIDHVFPWVLGGLTTPWNLVTLCRACNGAKSCYWQYRSGNIIWGRADRFRAPSILADCKRARRNPVRWWRAAWAL